MVGSNLVIPSQMLICKTHHKWKPLQNLEQIHFLSENKFIKVLRSSWNPSRARKSKPGEMHHKQRTDHTQKLLHWRIIDATTCHWTHSLCWIPENTCPFTLLTSKLKSCASVFNWLGWLCSQGKMWEWVLEQINSSSAAL